MEVCLVSSVRRNTGKVILGVCAESGCFPGEVLFNLFKYLDGSGAKAGPSRRPM